MGELKVWCWGGGQEDDISNSENDDSDTDNGPKWQEKKQARAFVFELLVSLSSPWRAQRSDARLAGARRRVCALVVEPCFVSAQTVHSRQVAPSDRVTTSCHPSTMSHEHR